MQKNNQVILIVLDGFGSSTNVEHNAIHSAKTPFFDSIHNKASLNASGLAVGLPEGQIGSSEIGHMTIGLGKALDTDLVRISKAIDNGTFAENEIFTQICSKTIENSSTLHLFGLLSPGGIHSHIDHIKAAIKTAAEKGVKKIAIHCFTDGRDVSPKSAHLYLQEIEQLLEQIKVGEIATVSGRYYAMDRDKNFDRIEKATSAIFECKGKICHLIKPSQVALENHENGLTDEFFEPLVFTNEENQGTSIKQFDNGVFLNFRADRARQISAELNKRFLEMSGIFASLTEYEGSQTFPALFRPEKIEHTLASVISEAGLTQVHIAETEKYAHATYFLNGGNEQVHDKERFTLIESRKDIKTHDEAPEMKAKEITDSAIAEIQNGTNFIFINYANADMVGHTGKFDATVKAIEVLDKEVSRLVSYAKNIPVLITADHGNAEQNFDLEKNTYHTAHTGNLVPIFALNIDTPITSGSLFDVAPTVLNLFGLEKPQSMTGKNLLQENL